MKRVISIVLILALLSSVCFTVANAYSDPLVGSKDSDVYHYSNCSYAKNIKQENLITFNDAQDAVNQGYHPCTRCNPPQPGGTIAPTIKPSPSPTPTAKPTVTPTPSSTPSATTKPTESIAVTAKPTANPATTLTPSPTATSTPTSTANPTNLPSPTPISTPITIGTPDAISPIDPTPQPQIISQSPAPSVPELGIPSLLIILMLASILALFSKRWQRKRL